MLLSDLGILETESVNGSLPKQTEEEKESSSFPYMHARYESNKAIRSDVALPKKDVVQTVTQQFETK